MVLGVINIRILSLQYLKKNAYEYATTPLQNIINNVVDCSTAILHNNSTLVL